MPKKVLRIRQMDRTGFKQFLKENGACQAALEWLAKQDRQDLQSIIRKVPRVEWLAWLLGKLEEDNRVRGSLPKKLAHPCCLMCACIYAPVSLKKFKSYIEVYHD